MDHERIRHTADAALLVLSARLMAVIGVPVAGFICVQAYFTLTDIQEKVTEFTERIVIVEQKQVAADGRDNVQDQRINRLEDKVFVNQ